MSYDATEYPFDTVVRVTDTMGGESFQGSGVLIAPDEVLTATHVVYRSDLGTANNIVVTPAYSGGAAPFGSADGTYIHYFQISDADGTITASATESDFAVIHLDTSFSSLGTMGLLSDFDGGPVSITGYPASAGGLQINSYQTVSLDDGYSEFVGTSLGEGSSGGPVWVDGADGPQVVGVVSSASGTTGYFGQITTSIFNTIEDWVKTDDTAFTSQPAAPAAAGIAVFDTSTNAPIVPVTQTYSGPVEGIDDQYINITQDSLNISTDDPNWFIHSGSGDDAIAVTSGVNVLDGGTGSNFLTGGSGTDTFFVDDRGPTADIWDTVDNFHSGDAATIWGVTPQDFNFNWVDGQGAAGYTGLTLHATASGAPTASLTLVGFTTADLANGRLSVSFGTVGGSAYMYVHDNT